MKKIQIFKKNVPTEIGDFVVYSDGFSLLGLSIPQKDFFLDSLLGAVRPTEAGRKGTKGGWGSYCILEKKLEIFLQLETQLKEYFAGDRRVFDLPLRIFSGTLFQRRAWAALQHISYGETWSYQDQARRMGVSSGASRAVGGANGRNPMMIVIPCHRVVRANGEMGGFSGGVRMKMQLLQLEGSWKNNLEK